MEANTKFKVGDTLVSKADGFWRVDAITEDRYLVRDIISQLTGYIPFEHEQNWHIATEEDMHRYDSEDEEDKKPVGCDDCVQKCAHRHWNDVCEYFTTREDWLKLMEQD